MNQIHETVTISPLCDIEESLRGSRVVIGEGSTVDAFVKIKFCGGDGDIIIGRGTYLNSGTVIYSGNGVTIGDHVLIAANCTFAATNHEFRNKDKLIIEQRFRESKGGIVVEDDVWLGANVVLLDGAHVATGCVIAAGSLVKGKTEPYGVYGGNPLRLISHRA